MFLLIPYTAITSAWAGGSLWPSQHLGFFRFLPEVLFALAFVYAWFPLIGMWSLLVGLWSYGWMQSATANGLHWGKGKYKPSRDTSFSPVVNWISDRLYLDRSSVNYCRLYMSIKGFLITLPVLGLGVILWPLGYEIGNRSGKHVVSELLSGAGAGLSILIFMWV